MSTGVWQANMNFARQRAEYESPSHYEWAKSPPIAMGGDLEGGCSGLEKLGT